MRAILTASKIVAISWIVLTVVVSGMPGMVLCIGADGHLALELSHEGQCHSGTDAAGHGQGGTDDTLAGEAPDCCGDCGGGCIDISLSSDSFSQPMLKVKRGETTADALAPVLASATTGAFICPEIDRGPPPPLACTPVRASSLLAQRTAVLLI